MSALKYYLLLVAAFIIEPVFSEAQTEVRLNNPFERGFPIQPVQSGLTVSQQLLPKGTPFTIEALNRHVGLKDAISNQSISVQWSDLHLSENQREARATAHYVTDLPARSKRLLKLTAHGNAKADVETAKLTVTENKQAKIIEVRTGRLGIRLPSVGSDRPPILKVCRLPEVHGKGAPPRSGTLPWLGRSRFLRTGSIERVEIERSAAGPVFYRQTMQYSFSQGTSFTCSVTCWAGLDYVTVEEKISGPASEWMRWEFEMEDWPTHVYTTGHAATHKLVHYRDALAYFDFKLAEIAPNTEFLSLPNYLIWSRFEEALLACFSRSAAGAGGEPPFDSEMLTIFQIRRGEWEDHLWAPKARRRLSDRPWQSWSQQRWWGAKPSAIRVIRNGHPKSGAFIRFSLFPGTRSWGLSMGDSSVLPPPRKAMRKPPQPTLMKTAVGEIRLTEHQHRIVDWQRDPKVMHPRMHVTPELIAGMEAKSRSDLYFTNAFETLQKDAAFRALITKDKVAAKKIALSVLHDMDTRINYPLTAGIEFSSHLSPVGVRPVFGHAAKIDLLLGADLLEPEIKDRLRHRFVYLAYLLTDSMFMAHKYNAGHPNFDADRYIAIAAAALLYPDHPHAKQWIDHVVKSLREAMRIYVIPQSGKWAENLGGYYNWSTNIIGGMAWALKFTGAADPYAWPEFQNFWKWGLVTSLPPKIPTSQFGKPKADDLPRVRLTAGIGDNGGDGGLAVHGGFALAGAGILIHNPELGRQLLWLWSTGGRNGYRHYPHSLFFGLSSADSELAGDLRSEPDFRSQLLDGYGCLFRSDFGKPTENYVLFKSGPGGYRYHGEEGSFVLFGHGQPLAFDGGTAWKAHEHSTVTFGDKKLGLYRGRIVQFESTPEVDYACGKFPGSGEQLARSSDPVKEMPRRSGWTSPFKKLFGRQGEAESPLPIFRALLGAHMVSDSEVIDFFASQRRSDVLTRQLLFRRNDYLVVCDQIESGLETEWRQLLVARDIERTRHQLVARGWLGVDVTVSLFHFDADHSELRPVDPETVIVDDQPLKQKRLTLKQGPGIGVVALLDFHSNNEKPWRVKSKGRALVLTSPDRKTSETVELRGGASPSASWQRRQGRQRTHWQHTEVNDPWPSSTPGLLKDGQLFVRADCKGAPTVFSPAGEGLDALRASDELERFQPSIEALRKEDLWSMLTLGPDQLSVVEKDGVSGWRYRELNESLTGAALMGRAAQAARNELPKQVAFIRTGNGAVEMFARRAITQYAGFSVRSVDIQKMKEGSLDGFSAAVLWQAKQAADLGQPTLQELSRFVASGGTLLVDSPTGMKSSNQQPAQLFQHHTEKATPRESLTFVLPEIGRVELSSAKSEGDPVDDLGNWKVLTSAEDEILKDDKAQPAVIVSSFGKGRIITFCFRVTSVGPDPVNQLFLAKLLQWSMQRAGIQPLVNAPWVEKTIIPQDDGGLLIGVWNPRPVSAGCPVSFPHHPTAEIQSVYRPTGGDIKGGRLVLPPRRWLVFGIK